MKGRSAGTDQVAEPWKRTRDSSKDYEQEVGLLDEQKGGMQNRCAKLSKTRGSDVGNARERTVQAVKNSRRAEAWAKGPGKPSKGRDAATK